MYMTYLNNNNNNDNDDYDYNITHKISDNAKNPGDVAIIHESRLELAGLQQHKILTVDRSYFEKLTFVISNSHLRCVRRNYYNGYSGMIIGDKREVKYYHQAYSTTVTNGGAKTRSIKSLYFYKVLICTGENETSDLQFDKANKRNKIIWFHESCLTSVDSVEEMETVSEYYKARPKEFDLKTFAPVQVWKSFSFNNSIK